jgi:hypothetical protein
LPYGKNSDVRLCRRENAGFGFNVKKVRIPRLQGLDPGEIAFRDFPFRLKKAANDKKVPDRVGSELFVLQKVIR